MKILSRLRVELFLFGFFTFYALAGPAQTVPASGAPAGNDLDCDVSEQVVAGGPNDFMEVRHLILTGSQRGIGMKLAEIANLRHGVQPWAKLDPRVTRLQADYFRQNYPLHFARMQGAAAYFGKGLDNHSLNFSTLAFNVEPLFGCSVVFYPPWSTTDRRGVLSRNLDFTTGNMIGRRPKGKKPAALSRPYIIESYPDEGYPSLFLCSMDLLGTAFDGINSQGLCAALLTDTELMREHKMEPSNDLQVGFNEIQLIRFLLETCADVDEAKDALLKVKHYYGFVPCHYIIADANGRAFLWEFSFSRNKSHIIENPGEPLVTTNFMLHQYPDRSKLPEDKNPQGIYSRFRRICERINGKQGKYDLEFIKETNACVAFDKAVVPANSPWGPNRTIWHALYFPEKLALMVDFYLGESIDPADPAKPLVQRSGYLEFRLEP